MKETAEAPHNRGRSTWIIVVALLIVLVLYPLSVGPAAWLLNRGYISDGPLAAVLYYPIVWTMKSFQAFGRLVAWYLDLWV